MKDPISKHSEALLIGPSLIIVSMALLLTSKNASGLMQIVAFLLLVASLILINHFYRRIHEAYRISKKGEERSSNKEE